MYKKLIMALFFAGTSLAIYGQQYSKKDLIGRWTFKYKFNKGDLVFFDSTFVSCSNSGLILTLAKYSGEYKNETIKLKYTTEINRKKKADYQNAEIKFLNDSTFLFKRDGKLPPNADTITKKVHVYRKIKYPTLGTELHQPSYHDLIGKWSPLFKQQNINLSVHFLNEKKVVFIKDSVILKEGTYRANFEVQPATIDFYFTDPKKNSKSFLGFEGERLIRIEEFFNNDRGDHFTVFGHNIYLVKDKDANEL